MKKFIGVICLGLLAAACTDPEGTNRALHSAGMSNIEITGYKWFGCDEKDSFHTGFKATNQNGDPVVGVACSGWFKGTTIRYY